MIISVTAAVLLLATALVCIASVIGRQNDVKRAWEEYEQAQNATHTPDTSETNVPPIVIPDDTGEERTGMPCSRDGMRIYAGSFAVQEGSFYSVSVRRG